MERSISRRLRVVAALIGIGVASGCGGDGGDPGAEAHSSSGSATDTAAGTDTEGTDAGTHRLVVDNFPIPTDETSYSCFDFTIQSDGPTHLIGFSPIVDNGSYVHHFVVGLLNAPTGQPPGYSCVGTDDNFVWGWSPGQGDFMFPAEAGYLVGNTAGGEIHLRLQIHYNNPQGTPGQVDSSGFEVFTTRELRPNNAGTLVAGDVVEIDIPPGMPAYEHVSTCRSEVTESVFPGPLQVFGASMHAHEIGSVLFTEVWRDGAMVGELNRDDPYLFEEQVYRSVDFELLPGDELRTRCVYDSTGRSEPTPGGYATVEEMCLSWIFYYPQIPTFFDSCGSSN